MWRMRWAGSAEMATVMGVEEGMFNSRPARALKADVAVMLDRVRDELPAIQELWPRFERLVGLRGRRMYAMVTAGTYAACTPVREDDDPAHLGLDTAILPGGWYLQARIAGEPPGLYERIGPAMEALEELASPADPARPLIEYYQRHDVIELWVPILANC
jgi:hypothetical protein